jgi:lysophospholipase
MVTELKYELVEMHDGISVQVGRFEPEKMPKGVLQIIHGFGEHIDRYEEMKDFFIKNNYICIIHDQRGFGIMPGKTKKQWKASRGIVSDYKLLLDDALTIREKINAWYPDVPVILYGHSMGGNIAINSLLRKPQSGYKKLILETPWLRLYNPPSPFKVTCARLGAKISHKLAVINKLDSNSITRDGQRSVKLKNDEYYHNRISLRLFTQVTDAGEYALKGAPDITVPTLLLCAGQDKIVSAKAIHEFYENAGENVILEEYPEGYHSLHTDIIKTEVLERMLCFCNE